MSAEPKQATMLAAVLDAMQEHSAKEQLVMMKAVKDVMQDKMDKLLKSLPTPANPEIHNDIATPEVNVHMDMSELSGILQKLEAALAKKDFTPRAPEVHNEIAAPQVNVHMDVKSLVSMLGELTKTVSGAVDQMNKTMAEAAKLFAPKESEKRSLTIVHSDGTESVVKEI